MYIHVSSCALSILVVPDLSDNFSTEVSNVMFEAKLMDCVSRVLRRFVATEGKAAVVVAVGKQLDLDGRVTSSLVEVPDPTGALVRGIS